MSKHVVIQRENQDEVDLIIQEFGDVSLYFEAKKSNAGNDFRKLESAINSFYEPVLQSGANKEFVNTEKIGDPVVVNQYKKNNFVVNNSGAMFNPIGIGVWVIESDFVVQ